MSLGTMAKYLSLHLRSHVPHLCLFTRGEQISSSPPNQVKEPKDPNRHTVPLL